MFVSSEKLVDIDQAGQAVADALSKRLGQMGISQDIIEEMTAVAKEAINNTADSPLPVTGTRALVSIDAEDIRKMRSDLTDEQMAVVLNADWSHLANTTIHEVVEDSLFDKIEALYPESDPLML